MSNSRPNEKNLSSTQTELSIAVESVSHRFALRDNGKWRALDALSNVSVYVSRSQFVALVGPSGCGKTTLLNLAAGLLPLQSGKVLVNGCEPAPGREDVAYMLARDALLPWRTAIKNVEYGQEIRHIKKSERRARAQDLLSAVGLTGFEGAYRSELSHGMRQRVALARTFALPSSILLMDEPFGALDVHMKFQLGELLLQLWESDKRTILFVTHDLHEAIALADRVLVMRPDPGRVVRDVIIDLPRPRRLRLLQSNRTYQELYHLLWNSMIGSDRAEECEE